MQDINDNFAEVEQQNAQMSEICETAAQEVERWRTMVSKRDLELEELRVRIREQDEI